VTVIDASRQFRERFVLTDSCVLSYPGATQVDELGGYTNLNVAQGQTPCRWVTYSKTELGKAADREDSNSAATLLVSSDVYVAFGSIVDDSFRVVGVSRTGSDIYKRLELEVIRTETIISAPIDPPEEPEEGELASSIVLSPPIESAEPGQFITLPYTITTENGLRPASVLILKNETGDELGRTVLDSASDPSESASFLYKLPSDAVGEMSVFLDVQYSAKSFKSNTVSFEVIELPIAIIDGVEFFEADLHVIETNGNGRIVTLPANEVLWVDWGTGDPAQLRPTGHEVITSFLDEETEREVVHRPRAISGPDTIMNQEVTIRALFSWNNGDQKTNLSWIKDVKQFGLNFETGKRNQVESGVRAFSQITAVQLTALENLDTSNLLYMNSMFIGASAFNQDLNNFDTSNVKSMANIFQSATDFDGDLSSWDLSSCTQLVSAFRFTNNFTGGGIENWDVSKVISWQEFLRRSFAFNAPIGGWTMSPEVNENRLREMFGEATSFNQDLSGWNVENCPTKPLNFDDGCDSWTLPRPVWGTDGSTTLVNEKKEG
jgi:surface protein